MSFSLFVSIYLFGFQLVLAPRTPSSDVSISSLEVESRAGENRGTGHKKAAQHPDGDCAAPKNDKTSFQTTTARAEHFGKSVKNVRDY